MLLHDWYLSAGVQVEWVHPLVRSSPASSGTFTWRQATTVSGRPPSAIRRPSGPQRQRAARITYASLRLCLRQRKLLGRDALFAEGVGYLVGRILLCDLGGNLLEDEIADLAAVIRRSALVKENWEGLDGSVSRL
jgi:hypothetical protein